MEPAAECMLVLIGATPEGKKELVGFQTGVRESAQSWRERNEELTYLILASLTTTRCLLEPNAHCARLDNCQYLFSLCSHSRSFSRRHR
jgi:hypothetical protein